MNPNTPDTPKNLFKLTPVSLFMLHPIIRNNLITHRRDQTRRWGKGEQERRDKRRGCALCSAARLTACHHRSYSDSCPQKA